jgi:hypothetical protein
MALRYLFVILITKGYGAILTFDVFKLRRRGRIEEEIFIRL